MENKPKISYETLWKFIIRPPRDEYTEDLLGEQIFEYQNKTYQFKDFTLISSQGYKMKSSFIEPMDFCRPNIEMPVVVYLHGNSSSRIEALNTAEVLLKQNINLFCIDFPGCGLSEGKYISLGYHEKNDVKIIIDFIENLPGVGKIGLWGRSMGAVTTLLYAHKDNRVNAICLDSPFENFKKLAKELTIKQINLPGFVIDGVLKIVRNTIKGKNGLDINKLNPIDVAAKTFQPALFIHAMNDELINIQHSIDIFNNYGGNKSLKCCEKGGHNSKRSQKIKKEIGEFFYKYLLTNASEDENKENNIIHAYNEVNDSDNYIDDDELEYMYDEDFIVNQICLMTANGTENNNNNNEINNVNNINVGIDKDENYKNKINKNKERIKNNEEKEKNQMKEMKEVLMQINDNIENDDFNINNDNENDEQKIDKSEEKNEDDIKNGENENEKENEHNINNEAFDQEIQEEEYKNNDENVNDNLKKPDENLENGGNSK